MESNLPQQKISIEQLPVIIGNTFKHISEVDRKISNAVSRAEEAKKRHSCISPWLIFVV